MTYAISRNTKGDILGIVSVEIPMRAVMENYKDWQGNKQQRVKSWEPTGEVPVIPEGFELYTDQGTPVIEAVDVPQAVTMRQARLALLAAGLIDQVEAAIDALPEPPRTAARIEWDYASEVHRASEFVTLLGAALELDKQSLDDLFLKAREL